ncbi:MAG: flagellar basal-body MS-ring/collar protein FliF [Desulfobacteraceae bacterium]|nr:flagellar basal-body MS-ring/collar protein FliF [Desulfobacteraceae bacterium]
MPNSIADILKQLRAIIQTMSASKMMALFILVAATVAGLVMMITWSGKPDFVPLYAHLTPEDAGEVVAALREKKIDYQLSHDGTTVQVPHEKLYEVRLDLASQGLPRGGLGFEVFDNTKLGVTEFVQNINYQRALQGELARTINGLEEVESTRVHIVMPQRSLFVEEEEPATASVILKLRHGRWLNDEQVQGIVHLVSSSVPRLTPANVTVVDNNGKMLTSNQDDQSVSKLTADHLEFQHRKERETERRITSMLEKVLGPDKAIVRAACDLDFIQQEKTEEMYLPENHVVRSEQLTNESSSQAEPGAGGIPGLAANITQPQSTTTTTTPATAKGFQKADATRNYEIGKTVSRKIMPVGKLQRLSVAVVVDGTYKTVMVGTGKNQREEVQYVPRTKEEITTFENIVKGAVNFDESRGDKVEVANMPFNTDKLMASSNEDGVRWIDRLKGYGSIFKYLAVALFVFSTFVYVIRPLISWLTDTSWEDVDLLEHLPRTISEIESQYAAKGATDNYVAQATQLITTNQEDSTRLMQQWLKET